MSQARVTDFFSQRKKAVDGPVKGPRRSSAQTRSQSSKKQDFALFSSPVHEEFARVVDEAAGVQPPRSPRTPKRSSAEVSTDPGAGVSSAAAEHSTAKKRRQQAGGRDTIAPEQQATTRRTARKKLVLPADSPQVSQQPPEGENQQIPESSSSQRLQPKDSSSKVTSAPPECENQEIRQSSSTQRPQPRGTTSKTLSKEDLVALKSRLQKIKKHGAKTSATRQSSVSTSSPASAVEASQTSTDTSLPVPDAQALRSTVARAKELAAKVQRRTVEREAEAPKQSETPATDSAEQPAYQKYHTLAQAVPPGLSLPYQYKVLAEMFRSMDTVVAMLYNRSETATFSKIKQGVQDMMRKRFEESHVAQIKTVFPEAYTLRQERNVPTFNSNIKKGSYQLTVEPLIVSDQNEARPLLSASRLLERRQIFHQNLVSTVKQHHKVFLSSLVPPMSVPEDRLTRWHPHFNVDTVPSIQASSLPQPPRVEKAATAQEVLEKARSLITPKMEKALVSVALKNEAERADSKETTSPQQPAAPQTPAAPVPAALKGVSQSLLDRIRAKETQKLQIAMTRNPNQEERLLMLSRLPELARILRNVFVAEKKPALIMEVACNRMVSSYRSALSAGEMEKHLRLLAEVAGDWLTVHPIRKDFYLKLNKNVEISVVVDKVTSRLKEESGH